MDRAQIREYMDDLPTEIIGQIQSKTKSIEPRRVIIALCHLAESRDEDCFRELVDAYAGHVMRDDPIYPKPKTGPIPKSFSNRVSALKFIEYLCQAGDHGIGKITRLNGTKELEIRSTQRFFREVMYPSQ